MTDRYQEIAEFYRRWDDSLSEHDERVRKAIDEANWYFNHVTQPQQAARAAIFSNLLMDYSPRAIRARERANAAYEAATAEAEALRLRAFEDCMRDGETSQFTGSMFTKLLIADEAKAICADLRKIAEMV